jgi:hypothetical protein
LQHVASLRDAEVILGRSILLHIIYSETVGLHPIDFVSGFIINLTPEKSHRHTALAAL